MELKHYTSAEIYANMNETCDVGIFTHPHWDWILDHPAHSQLLYWLNYLAHFNKLYV